MICLLQHPPSNDTGLKHPTEILSSQHVKKRNRAVSESDPHRPRGVREAAIVDLSSKSDCPPEAVHLFFCRARNSENTGIQWRGNCCSRRCLCRACCVIVCLVCTSFCSGAVFFLFKSKCFFLNFSS